jgi:F420 biosynthesis protein FbiB-like protein
MSILIDHSQLTAVAKLIAARRSIRRYRPEPVPTALLDGLLQCAANAPSAHNRQPWRFVALHDHRSKVRLAEAMGAQLRADRLKDGDPASAIEADVARSFERISRAPVVLLVAATTAEMDAYPDPRRQNAEYVMAIQSTAMATQNLLLAVHAAGLAACWMCAPLFCPDTVRKVLELPMDWQPQSLITIGFPASAGKPYTREPLEKVVRHVGAP